jgi:phosphopantothenoylcysteine decarboxylase/phosphopantothenate--cysteine ligase
MKHHVLLLISGSIAAYKTPDLVRNIVQAGHRVTCVLTPSAPQFVTPLALEAVSHHKVYSELYNLTDEHEMGHITLARSPDMVLVAPATADIMAKMAHGMADDLASTLLLATNKPILVAPAMNHHMWQHPATQRNVAMLKNDGVRIIPPAEGELACGEVGHGKMADIAVITQLVQDFAQKGTAAWPK